MKRRMNKWYENKHIKWLEQGDELLLLYQYGEGYRCAIDISFSLKCSILYQKISFDEVWLIRMSNPNRQWTYSLLQEY